MGQQGAVAAEVAQRVDGVEGEVDRPRPQACLPGGVREVLQVGGEEVSTDDEFARGIMSAFQRGALPLLVQRGRRGYFITLPTKGLKT